MMRRGFLLGPVAGLVLAGSSSAQRGTVPVHGVVFDSLRGQPIRNAAVTIAGSGRVITTDSRGRFQFDSLSPGPYRFSAQHPLLDSIGLSGLLAKSTITDGREDVRLAVPSFATLWRVAGGASRAPKDSAIVYGTIRAAGDGAPVSNAMVELIWSDLVMDNRRHVMQRRWRIETRSNAEGGYALCGVAPALGLRVHAASDSAESGAIDMAPLTTRVQRKDLLVGSFDMDSANVGSISGVVLDAMGLPVSDVRIILPGRPEVRTDAEGKFLLSRVPAGTRQFDVLAIGAAPTAAVADVTPGTATPVVVTLPKVVTLAPSITRSRTNARTFGVEFAARRKAGFGYMRDSTDLVKYEDFVNVLRDVPSLNVTYRWSMLAISVPDGRGKSCAPDVVIDGAVAGFGHLSDLSPKEVAGVEVYPRAAHIPAQFVPPGIHPQCGMILVWTKYGMRNR
jgi:hypothetical protein